MVNEIQAVEKAVDFAQGFDPVTADAASSPGPISGIPRASRMATQRRQIGLHLRVAWLWA